MQETNSQLSKIAPHPHAGLVPTTVFEAFGPLHHVYIFRGTTPVPPAPGRALPAKRGVGVPRRVGKSRSLFRTDLGWLWVAGWTGAVGQMSHIDLVCHRPTDLERDRVMYGSYSAPNDPRSWSTATSQSYYCTRSPSKATLRTGARSAGQGHAGSVRNTGLDFASRGGCYGLKRTRAPM
jgi:hypothetical protein